MPEDHEFTMERKGRLSEMDRQFDREYWQRLGPEAIFAAAWEMVVEANRAKGGNDSELEFQKSVESIRRTRSHAEPPRIEGE